MENDNRPFIKNMLKSVFKTKVSNAEEISSPVVEAIRENTEAIKDKDTAKQMSKPIVTALVDVMEKLDEKKDFDDSKLDKLFSHIQEMKVEKILDEIESIKGDQGEPGHTPTEEELVKIIEPLIPDPLKGDKGDDYILTEKDKKDIAKSVKVNKIISVDRISDAPIGGKVGDIMIVEDTREVYIYE